MRVAGDFELRPDKSGWSSGELRMSGADGVLDVDGSVELASTREKAENQYAGRLRIGKDLRVWSYDGSKSFCPWSTHITEFKGAGTHEVDFDSADVNNLFQVEVTGGGSLYLTGKTSGFKLLSDARFAGGSTISGNRKLELNGNTVTVEGDFRQAGTLTVDLTGSKMNVEGTYWQNDGILSISSGTLHVAENYELRPDKSGWSNGELYMTSEKGVLDVDGSVELASTRKKAENQYAGRLRIGKNLRVWSYDGSKSFCPWSAHITEFKGETVHEVDFDSAEVNNLFQVEVTDGGSLYLTGKTSGFKLLSDAHFADGSTISGDRKLELNGNTVTVDGDFRQMGTLKVDLSGSSMNVEGTYWQGDGILSISSGTMHVKGNYALLQPSGDWSRGELYMTSEKGVLDVDGNAELASLREKAENQYGGRLRIGGDLRVWSYDGSKSFCPWSAHITEFKGETVHEVNFDSAEVNNLYQVEVTDGGSLYLMGKTTGFRLLSDARFADGSTISGERKLELNGNTVTVDGDFRQAGKLTVDLSGSRMYVAGTYWQNDGILSIGSGTLNIAKNYELRPDENGWSSGELYMTDKAGALITGGSVELASTRESASKQYAGTVSIGENLKVWSYNGSQSFHPWQSQITEFRGGKAHEVYFDAAGANHLHTVQLGVGDTISFTKQFGEIAADGDPAITVEPEGLASVSGLSVTGKSAGEGKMKLVTGDKSEAKTLIVGASDVEAAYDGGTAVPGKRELTAAIGGSSVYYLDYKADIPVTVKGEIPADAWITFVPSDVPHTEKDGDDHNGDYVRLKDIRGGIAHLSTPSKPGTYDIRVYDGDDADTAKEIAYKTVKVIYSDLKAEVRVDSKIIKPGEKVRVYVTHSGLVREDAWVTFAPSDIAHTEKDTDDHNGDYKRLTDLSDGYVTLTAPTTEGSWDIRVLDGDYSEYAREAAYITVVVTYSEDATEPTDPPKPTEPTEKPTDPADEPTEPADAKLLPGDVNLDGEVSIMDVIAINRYLLGVSQLGSKAKQNANVDGNESIDAADSLLILKYALEIIDTLGG